MRAVFATIKVVLLAIVKMCGPDMKPDYICSSWYPERKTSLYYLSHPCIQTPFRSYVSQFSDLSRKTPHSFRLRHRKNRAHVKSVLVTCQHGRSRCRGALPVCTRTGVPAWRDIAADLLPRTIQALRRRTSGDNHNLRSCRQGGEWMPR